MPTKEVTFKVDAWQPTMFYAKFHTEQKYGWDLTNPVGPETPPKRRYRVKWENIRSLDMKKARIRDYAEYMLLLEPSSKREKANIDPTSTANVAKKNKNTLTATDGDEDDDLLPLQDLKAMIRQAGHFKVMNHHAFEKLGTDRLCCIESLLQETGAMAHRNIMDLARIITDICRDAKQAELTMQHEIEGIKRTQTQNQATLKHIQDQLDRLL